MALKQLMLRKTIEQARSKLAEMEPTEATLETRSEDLSKAIEEASTDEELALVNEELEVLEKDQKDFDENKQQLAERISTMENELAELEKKSEAKPKTTENRSDANMQTRTGELTREERAYLGRMDIRSQVRESLNTREVQDFYGEIRDIMTGKKRAINDAELIIPHTVYNRIQILVGDYGVMYREVDVIPLNGTARVVLDGSNPEGIWVEMCEPLQELSVGFNAVEVDGYKVGGFFRVCNAILEDSMINLAMYLERKLAISIAKALDKAILLGIGSLGKQPMGIIPNLAAANQVTLADNAVGGIFGSLFGYMSLIDTGENSIGEVIAVMKRATYYKSVAPRLVLTNSSGTYTLPNIQNPNFAGLRVVLSQYMPDDKVLVGDFKKYILAERAGVKLSSSNVTEFIQDNTLFKGTARYDGKPLHLDSNKETVDWILADIPAPANP